MEPKRTVRQVSKLTGVSVRTLHYYDEIGLLHPHEIGENGYRLYSEADICLLQQILFFRELDFPLKEIRLLMRSPSFDRQKALIRHRQLLLLKQQRIARLLTLLDDTLKGENTSMSFDAFDNAEYERLRAQYAQEAKERFGKTQAFSQFEEKTSKMSPKEKSAFMREMNGLFSRFAEKMSLSPDHPEVQELVKSYKDFITQNCYTCTDEILRSLGEMYVQDTRFSDWLDRYKKGLSAFLYEAICAYVQK